MPSTQTKGRIRLITEPYASRQKARAAKTIQARYRFKKQRSVPKPVKRYIKKASLSQLETKELRYMLWSPTAGAGSAAYTLRNAISDLSIKPLLCPIEQSDSAKGNSPFRLGNEIIPVSLIVKVKLYIKSDEDYAGLGAADRGAIQPFLFVGQDKNTRNVINLTANNYNKILPFVWRKTDGLSTQENPTDGGEVTSFTGDRGEFVTGRYNDSLLRPIKGGIKTPVMTRDVIYWQNTVDGGGGGSNRHVERNYVFNVPCPKKLKFTNNEATYPDNFAPFLMCGFTYVGGADPSIQAPLRIETAVHFKYKDP